MRVLHVLDFSPPFPGSMVDHLAVLGRALHERGDSLIVALPRERPWFRDLEDVARILVMPQIRRPLRSRFAAHLEEVRRQTDADLVHLAFSFALPFALACALRRPRVPVVFHWHNPPRPLLSSTGRSGAAWGGLPSRAAGVLARFTDRRAIDLHLTVSEEIRDLLTSHHWARREKIVCLPNALPRLPAAPTSVDGRAFAESGRPGPVIGAIANFRPQKDHGTLLRAFAGVLKVCPLARLVLVGDGPTRPAMEGLASALGLSASVEFRGAVADPGAAYREFDLFVLSTRYEGHALVLLEAMGHALPIVATGLPVVRETLRDGLDALLVPPEDAPAMASALLRMIAEPDLRARLGTSARTRVDEEFNPERWTACLLRLYDAIKARSA